MKLEIDQFSIVADYETKEIIIISSSSGDEYIIRNMILAYPIEEGIMVDTKNNIIWLSGYDTGADTDDNEFTFVRIDLSTNKVIRRNIHACNTDVIWIIGSARWELAVRYCSIPYRYVESTLCVIKF